MQETGHRRVRGGYLDELPDSPRRNCQAFTLRQRIYNTRRLHAVLCVGEISRGPFSETYFCTILENAAGKNWLDPRRIEPCGKA